MASPYSATRLFSAASSATPQSTSHSSLTSQSPPPHCLTIHSHHYSNFTLSTAFASTVDSQTAIAK